MATVSFRDSAGQHARPNSQRYVLAGPLTHPFRRTLGSSFASRRACPRGIHDHDPRHRLRLESARWGAALKIDGGRPATRIATLPYRCSGLSSA